jgi:hypothetical protein
MMGSNTEQSPESFDAQALMREIDRDQAARAAVPPERIRRYYDELEKEYLRLSAPKRSRGYGDCTEEMQRASKIAAARVWPPPWRQLAAAVPKVGTRNGSRPRGAGRPRAAASRSSAASGDSGPDGGLADPPPSRAKPGVERLLTTLARGLDDDVLPYAAALVVALDGGAR